MSQENQGIKLGDITTCKWCKNPRRVGGPKSGDTGSLTWKHKSYGCGAKSKKQLFDNFLSENRIRRGKRLATATYSGCGHKVQVEVSIRHRGDVVRSGSCPTCNITYNFFGGVGDAFDTDEYDE